MNKLTAVILFFIIPVFILKAQEDGTGMAKFRMGIAMPVGEFGKHEGSLQYSSFATSGLNIGYETAYFYTDNIGFGLYLSYNRNKIDEHKLVGAYLNTDALYDTAVSSVKPFRSFIGAVGLYLYIPFNDYFAFTSKMLIGSFVVHKPVGVVNIETFDGHNVSYNQTSTTSSKFAMLTGLGFQLTPIPRWSVTADIEYIGSTMSFTYNEKGVSAEHEEAVKFLQIAFGVSFKIE